MKPTYFRMYASCIAVKGAARSSICDLQRQSVSLIPNDLYEIIRELENHSVEDIHAMYGEENKDTIAGYIQFLTREEFGFLTRNPQQFSQPATIYDTPEIINNAIIDNHHGSTHDFAAIINQLEDLGCKYLMLRYFDPVQLDQVSSVLQLLHNSRFRSATLLMPYDSNVSDQAYEDFFLQAERLTTLTLHSAPKDGVIKDGLKIYTVTQNIDSETHCGIISQDYFVYNTRTYREGLSFNTCLHKKISIDANGNICNCPSMPDKVGKFGEISFHTALALPALKKAWKIHKDEIETCKDCEFRRICTDCRAYIQDPKNLYSKPAKCGYDPYTTTWSQAAEKAEQLSK